MTATSKQPHLFQSVRLGFRTWRKDDLEAFSALNACREVMEYFPRTLERSETEDFLNRLMAHQEKHGYCYYAVELLATGEFLGFIGFAYQTYTTEFAPGTDIGWRLKKSAWGQGLATEGAQKCLDYGFDHLGLQRVFATCNPRNKGSEKVMRKIGMQFQGTFVHPRLLDEPHFKNCIWYKIEK